MLSKFSIGPARPRSKRKRPATCGIRIWRFPKGWMLLFAAFPGMLCAADLDESKLPQAATIKIDFARDIKPILETSCLRCHGPEKTKSGFRLDNRVAAMKGGEKGVDIFSGQGAKSPLVHYVANLVEDMEMPPAGKGTPLTASQVGLLRAWIDQGVLWDVGNATNFLDFSISPLLGGTIINGDNHKFREHYWQKEGINGGIEQFDSFDQLDPDTKIQLSGHALQDDYKISLFADRNELGFIHSGWEQYRKYFDDTGGFYPAAGDPSSYSLGRDLHLDIGKAWIDVGLALPRFPKMVLGYEYDYKKGGESLTSWGHAAPNQPNIAPVGKNLDEAVHIIKFDLDYETHGVAIAERFRGEFYRLSTQRSYIDARAPIGENVGEGTTYFQGANTLRLEKKFTDWFFGSAGYLYSRLNSDATFKDAFNNNNLATVPNISLQRESHVFNVNTLMGPFDGLTLSTGAQSEWTREEGFGSGSLNRIDIPSALATLAPLPSVMSSSYDDNATTETAGLRYNKIPFTALFADARLRQERLGEIDMETQTGNPPPGGNYLQNTADYTQLSDLRIGFNTSPFQRVSFSSHYRRYESDSHYHNNPDSLPPGGYPGFLNSRDILTDEFEAKLVLRATAWFKTTLSYQYLNSDYHENTGPAFGFATSPGGQILSGQSNSKNYSINAVLTPWRRLYLSATFSYQPSTTLTANNNAPGIVPYRGNLLTLSANATYTIDDHTDLFANYFGSEADFGQNNFAAGLPVGLEYQQQSVQIGLTRRLTKNLSSKILYGFNSYNDASHGGTLNYTAHTILAAMTLRIR